MKLRPILDIYEDAPHVWSTGGAMENSVSERNTEWKDCTMAKPRRLRDDYASIDEVIPGVKYRIRYYADLRDGRGWYRHSLTVWGTLSDAVKQRDELKAKYFKHGGRKRSPLVSEFWEDEMFDLFVELGNSRRTIENKRKVYNAQVGPKWGNRRLDEITTAEVKAWLKGLTPSMATSSLSVLRAITNHALVFEYIERDPLVAKIPVPKSNSAGDGGHEDTRKVVRDAQPYWDAVRGTRYEAGFLLMIGAGCRPGEALGVTLDNIAVDADGKVRIAIVDQANELGELEGRVKNRQSRRVCAVAGSMGERLVELRDQARSDGDVFLTDRGIGKPMSTKAFLRGFKRHVKAAGLEVVDPRSLRPSWSTAMLKADADPHDVNRLMGHTPDSKVLWQHYDRSAIDASVNAVVPIWDN